MKTKRPDNDSALINDIKRIPPPPVPYGLDARLLRAVTSHAQTGKVSFRTWLQESFGKAFVWKLAVPLASLFVAGYLAGMGATPARDPASPLAFPAYSPLDTYAAFCLEK